MADVFFFDLRDADTYNFDKLSDDKYLLWDKKSNDMKVDDYCLVYYYKKAALITTKIIQDRIYPQKDGDKWFVEFNKKKYFFENKGGFGEFVVFEKINEYRAAEDLKVSSQGGVTLLTQSGETVFKQRKLAKLAQVIKERDILKILNRYVPNTILDAIIDALENLKEATKEEIYEYIKKVGSYIFGAEDPLSVIGIELERHCKDSKISRKSISRIVFYKKGSKYGLISDLKIRSQTIGLLEKKKQIVLYGPPGTGKTYDTKKIALDIIESE